MSKEVQLWKIEPGDRLAEVTPGKLNLEARIEAWLEKDITILDPGLLVIGRQVRTDHAGKIDLLCIEATGDLVVVELKRDCTPREITAQALDYGSWVQELLPERITSIAEAHLGEGKFEEAFRQRFESDLPETLNESHRLLIVGSEIDPASERIIRYLSDTYGVNINAATFQYFQENEGRELLARVFLLKPAQVEHQSRTKGQSKRRMVLTDETLDAQAEEHGVTPLFTYARRAFSAHLGVNRTTSGVTFQREGRAYLGLLPAESNPSDGLRYQVYHRRIATLAGCTPAEVEQKLPGTREPWNQYAKSPNPDYQGFRGFFQSTAEIDAFADVLKSASELV